MDRIQIAPDGPEFTGQTGDTVLKAALRAGLGFPYECGVGVCGTCKFELLDGQVAPRWEDAPGLNERDRRKGRHLACQSALAGDCTIRLRLDDNCTPAIAPGRQQAVLRQVRSVTHDIREFTFVTTTPARFLPGQFALLSLPGVAGERAYSMANLPNDAGEWQFMIRRRPAGEGTRVLFDQLVAGDCIEIDAPLGLAQLRPEIPRDIVCISGGSGIAPMLSIARAMAADATLAKRQLNFFFGGRTVADLCGQDVVSALAGFGSRIFYYAAVSDPAPDDLWAGPRGLIHELVAKTLAGRLAEQEYYLAGPPPMIHAVRELLVVSHGVPASQLHFDRFF